MAVWLISTLCPVLADAGDASATPRHRYRQSPAPLVRQLADVAARHEVNLVDPESRTPRATSAGLQGEWTLAEALDRLLAPEGLAWEALGDGTIRIVQARQPLRLEVGTVEVRDARWPTVSAAVSAERHSPVPGNPPWLLAQRTSAGWSLAAPMVRTLPSVDLGRWLARAPNAYGQGSRMSLRGIERDSFAAQTSSVLVNGIPLSAEVLDAGMPLPPGLVDIDYALGPQPDQTGLPGFAGMLGLGTADPAPVWDGGLRVGIGVAGRDERRMDLWQSVDLAAAGSAQLLVVDRRQEGRVQHVDGRPRAHDRLAIARWWLEPEARPEFSLSLDLLDLRSRPADERILVPLAVSTVAFDPAARSDAEPARSLAVDAQGARLGLRWAGAQWTQDALLLSSTSAQRVREPLRDARDQWSSTLESVHVGQWAASRAFSGEWRVRASVDQVRRDAWFNTADTLPLQALFPADGLFMVSAGSERRLETRVIQRSDSHAVQVWVAREGARWSLEAGASWADERRREEAGLSRGVSAGCVLTARDGSRRPCTDEVPEIHRNTIVRQRDQRLSPAVTAVWQGAAGQVGLQWRRGFRSGGIRPVGAAITAYRPERSDTLELSWRMPEWRGWRMRTAVFDNRWRDRQVQVLDATQSGFGIANAGRARAGGAELTLGWNWGADWSLALGVGWLQTRFDAFQLPGPGGPVDLSGNRFASAPTRTALLGISRSPPHGWEFGALLNAAGRAEGDAYNTPEAQLLGRAELDLRLGWRGRRFGWGLEVLNATDRALNERVVVSLAGNQPRSYGYNAPRQWRGTVEWRW